MGRQGRNRVGIRGDGVASALWGGLCGGRDEDACRLIEQNREKFGLSICGLSAAQRQGVLQDLPAPDSVFLGGSGGMVEEILQLALQKNPYVRVVINAITLETVAAATQA